MGSVRPLPRNDFLRHSPLAHENYESVFRREVQSSGGEGIWGASRLEIVSGGQLLAASSVVGTGHSAQNSVGSAPPRQ